ncbi:AIS_collapsed_G0043730.mRNA.1.CDS.1 [Saccharomyces cerevisiae]|nr:AIS_collapsed_G0043730.mRNA.1.CDS.1 [Saccharomyces cerevisiae]
MRFHRQGISAIIGVLLIVLLGFCWKLSGSYGIVSTALPHNQSAIKSTDLPSIRWDNYHEFVRDIDFDNSTAIFNSIRAALRQSPSDIHPVGVSYFPAVIPKGTLMYHAGSKVPTTFEWLAMDHEFSYSFGLRSPSYGRKSLERRHGRFGNGTNGDHPKGPPPPPPPPDEKGRGSQKMLTYRAARDLNKFLYLDGASAAKTDSGEMDTQLMLSNVIKEKLNLTDDGENERMAERLYAARICKWGKPFGLDGIIRVEVGFEVVLCDFSADNVELVSMLEMVQPNQYLGLPAPTVISKEEGWPLDEKWKPMSGINRTYIAPDPNNRRLLDEGMTWEKQLDMVDDLEKALEVGFDATQSMDWQLAFDELVLKFAPLLKSVSNILNSDGDINESIAINATALTLNFYFLIWSSAVSVVGEIVDVIYKVNDLLIPEVYSFMTDNTTSSDLIKNVETARSTIDGLIESLGWIELNYRCERQCNWDEVCYTPSWGPSPMGMTEPGSHNEGFGTHFDESRQRLVINSKLQCININDLMVNRNH